MSTKYQNIGDFLLKISMPPSPKESSVQRSEEEDEMIMESNFSKLRDIYVRDQEPHVEH